MLKRLEIVGFKSFADKTVFDFSAGLTAIVGPNGSGKSNIVDAIRWILGEQSAKSLRGGEMADVIFNGSTSRRSHGLAEVTMTFDNRRRQLAVDMEEVQITRRVYRSGEGEYLINGQPSRLKDIKELFLGSGAGADAYSIIAQGQVEVLLQTSTKDRRTIFEEAAGISRFKAKKFETLRKLERVDQNLARVKDIIEEVDKQLRSVKQQAAKAERYQEYSSRLRDLRVALALDEYHRLSLRLEAESAELSRLRGELDQSAARAAASEADAERLEFFLADLDDALHDQEARLARIVQEISNQEMTLTHEAAVIADVEKELERTRRRWTELSQRVSALTEAVEAAQVEVAAAEAEAAAQRQQTQALESELDHLERRWSALQQQLALDQAEHLEQMRRAAHRQNEAVAAKAQLDNLQRERQRLEQRRQQAIDNLAHIDRELERLIAADGQFQERLTAARNALAAQRRRQEELRLQRDQIIEQLAQLRQEHGSLASRIDVLTGLMRDHEGLGAGVREVFALFDRPDNGPWSTVVGMIADFLTVKRDYAHLIDLALGEWAQRFIVRDVDRLIEALAARTEPFSGRVSFMPIAPSSPSAGLAELRSNRLIQVSLLSRVKDPDAGAATPRHPGLVAPATQVVSCDHPELADLVDQLLQRTLIVRDLATARAIAAAAPGYRLVTLQGELLEPDGTVTTGAPTAAGGPLARKSELHALQDQAAELGARIAQTEQQLQHLRDQWEQGERTLQAHQEELALLTDQASEAHGRVERHRDRRQGLHEELLVSQAELKKIEDDIAEFGTRWQKAHDEAAVAEAEVARLHTRLHEADVQMQQLDQQRQMRQTACTQARVALATVDERLRALRNQHQQLERDRRQRQQEYAQTVHGQAACKQRLAASQLNMLRASAALAQAYLDKESIQNRRAEQVAQRDSKRQERARLVQLVQSIRTEWRDHQDQYHSLELTVNDVRHQRDTLVERLRDDYQLELAELYAARGAAAATAAESDQEPGGDADAVQQEIAELRRKIQRLGNVNLEALAELQELERRSADLQTQFADLTAAKKALEEILHKINQDSKRLFTETFETVRGHFQELFRKLFGGGMADIQLEDENDILECGIEIVARPPGKELRSISLLSGGEKTLTAVALLLAIFRSKPSPFCVLDEVDAALDEVNIGRFIAVLREFLQRSQFIIVTHSKKTMAAADVLYGITMQESGVSKQVTIRFEDWVEDDRPQAEVA